MIHKECENPPNDMKNPVFKLFLLLFFGVLLLVGVFFFKLFSAATQGQEGNPLFPAEMNAAQFAKQEFVIGDLGGVPVRIPHYFANYVEYDDDPGFGEKRKGPALPRTYKSRLRSFGFEARFPDMAGRSSPELWQDYNQYHDVYWKDYYDPVKSITPWISVSFNTGSIYPGDRFLDYYVNATLAFKVNASTAALHFMEYEKQPNREHGLTVYAVSGIDPKTKQPYRTLSEDAKDFYVHHDASGKVDAYIKCQNHRYISKRLCIQTFDLEPKMKSEVYVMYYRTMLPQWQKIQINVIKLVSGFKVDEAVL